MVAQPCIEKIVEEIRKRVQGVELIYFFGSAAESLDNDQSDLDFAFLSSQPISPLDRFNIQCEIANIANRDVDLVNLATASEVMRAEVLRTGQPLYVADEDRRAAFEVFVLSRYAHLNEERAQILKDFYGK